MKKYVKEKKRVVKAILDENVAEDNIWTDEFKKYVEKFVDSLFDALGTKEMKDQFVENMQDSGYDMHPFSIYLWQAHHLKDKEEESGAKHLMIKTIVDNVSINLSKKWVESYIGFLDWFFSGEKQLLKHKKIPVTLTIEKISKHVSNIELENIEEDDADE